MTLRDRAYWIRSGLLSLMDKVGIQLLRFGSFYLLVRGLSKEDYGIWLLFLAICAFIEVARLGLVQNAAVRYLSVAKGNTYAVINTAALVINVIIALVSLVLVYGIIISYPLVWYAPALKNLLLVYLINTVILIPFFHFMCVQKSNMDFRGVTVANLVREGLFFLYVVACVIFPEKSGGLFLLNLALFQVVATALATLVALGFSAKYMQMRFLIDRRWMRKLFKFGKYSFGTSMGAMLIKNIDQFMLAGLLSPVAVAVYGICIKIANLVEIPTQTLSEIAYPKGAKRIHKEGISAARHLYERSVGVILAMIIPCIIFVWAFPEWIIMIIAGDQYLEAVPILRLTMLYTLFIPYARQFGMIMDALGRPAVNFYFVIVGSLLNIILNAWLISLFGIYGAVYGTLISYILIVIGNHIYLRKYLKVTVWGTFFHTQSFYVDSFNLGIGFIKQRLNKSEA